MLCASQGLPAINYPFISLAPTFEEEFGLESDMSHQVVTDGTCRIIPFTEIASRIKDKIVSIVMDR
jgi:hypothetical protein